MSIVVDASVAIKWVAHDEEREAARQLIATESSIVAPQLMLVEAANTLRLKVVRRQMDEGQARAGFQFIERTVDRFVPDGKLAERALSLAFKLDHPAYECIYLACAEREKAAMITADERLLRKLAGNPQWMHVRALSN